ncbi:hypothetical protein [Pontibacter rugosus]
MKPLFLAILLISFFSGGITSISRINQYAKDAATAYSRKEYIEAIAAYTYLLNDLEVEDDQLRLNLAHSYYQAGLYSQAMAAYRFWLIILHTTFALCLTCKSAIFIASRKAISVHYRFTSRLW